MFQGGGGGSCGVPRHTTASCQMCRAGTLSLSQHALATGSDKLRTHRHLPLRRWTACFLSPKVILCLPQSLPHLTSVITPLACWERETQNADANPTVHAQKTSTGVGVGVGWGCVAFCSGVSYLLEAKLQFLSMICGVARALVNLVGQTHTGYQAKNSFLNLLLK